MNPYATNHYEFIFQARKQACESKIFRLTSHSILKYVQVQFYFQFDLIFFEFKTVLVLVS